MKEFAQKRTGLLAVLAMAVLLAVSVFVLAGCQQNNQPSNDEATDTTEIKVPAISVLSAEEAYPYVTSVSGATADPAALDKELFAANADMADQAKEVLAKLGAEDIEVTDDGYITANVPTEAWDEFTADQWQQALEGIAMGYTITSAWNWEGLSENSGVNQIGVEPDAQMDEIVLTVDSATFELLGPNAGAIMFWQANQWIQNYAFLTPDYAQPADERITIIANDVEEDQVLFESTFGDMTAELEAQEVEKK